MAEILYCYRCGKHVKRGGAGKCWYCAAPIQRLIRPERHCRFCDEIINPKAIKCPHCGEFLDDRAPTRPEPAEEKTPNVTYVIDKAVIQAGQALPGGQTPSLSARSAPMLPDGTAAPQPDSPAALPAAAQGALPAPDARGDIVPAQDVTDAQIVSIESPGAAPPAPLEPKHPVLDRVVYPLLRGTGRLALRGMRAAVGAWVSRGGPDDAEFRDAPGEEDRYSVCGICNSEVLAIDSFCFHCGTVLREDAEQRTRKIKHIGPGNAARFALSLVCIAAMVYVGTKDQAPLMDIVAGVLAAVSLLLLIDAFMRRRTSGNQMATLILLVLWAGALAVTFLPGWLF